MELINIFLFVLAAGFFGISAIASFVSACTAVECYAQGPDCEKASQGRAAVFRIMCFIASVAACVTLGFAADRGYYLVITPGDGFTVSIEREAGE